jgi:hypothetical protein
VSATSGQEAFVAAIDPTSLSVVDRFSVPRAPDRFQAGRGYLRGVTNTNVRGTVFPIDPEAQRVVQTLRHRVRIHDMVYNEGALCIAAPSYVYSIRL